MYSYVNKKFYQTHFIENCDLLLLNACLRFAIILSSTGEFKTPPTKQIFNKNCTANCRIFATAFKYAEYYSQKKKRSILWQQNLHPDISIEGLKLFKQEFLTFKFKIKYKKRFQFEIHIARRSLPGVAICYIQSYWFILALSHCRICLTV